MNEPPRLTANYRRLCEQLDQPGGMVAFLPWEFALFVLERNGLSEEQFSETVGYYDRFLRSSHLVPGSKLAAKLVSALAFHSTQEPYTDPLFWRQEAYHVTHTEAGLMVTDKNIPFPKLKRLGYEIPTLYHTSHGGAAADKLENRLQEFAYGPQDRAEITLKPFEFLRFLCMRQHIDETELSTKISRNAQYLHYSIASDTLQIPGTTASALAQLSSPKPYQECLFWRQKEFTLTRRGEQVSLEFGTPSRGHRLPELTMQKQIVPLPAYCPKGGSPYDLFETKAIALLYGKDSPPIRFTPVELFLLAARRQGIPLEAIQRRFSPGDAQGLYKMMREGLTPAWQRKIAECCTGPGFASPEFWATPDFAITPQTPIPDLDKGMFSLTEPKPGTRPGRYDTGTGRYTGR